MTAMLRGAPASALFLVLVCCSLVGTARAHPPVSLVMDSGGNVYFSDLTRVWVIRVDGTVEVAVDGVHTHELYLDAEDNLYGDDVPNVGDNYRHRVWMRSPDGRITNDLDWREGHPVEFEDFSLVRDAEGRSYVLNRGARRLDVRQGDRVVRTFDIGLGSEPIHWMTLGNDGRIVLAVGSAVYEVPGDQAAGDGALRLIATDLVEGSLAFAFVQARHALMGMWTDPPGNVFVAVFKGKVVKRITPQGEVSHAYRSRGLWSPVGGFVAPDGALWILEWSPTNSARVVRSDGNERTVYRPG